MSLVLLGILNSQVSGAAAGDYELLETQVLTSSASSVTFTGLGSYSDYKHLQIRAVVQSDRTNFEWDFFAIRLNGDTGNNYAYHWLSGNGSSVSSDQNSSLNYIYSNPIVPAQQTSEPNTFGAVIWDILDFSNTNKNTTLRSVGGQHKNNYTGETPIIAFESGLWNNTSAVTQIAIALGAGNFNANSRFSLYGIKGA